MQKLRIAFGAAVLLTAVVIQLVPVRWLHVVALVITTALFVVVVVPRRHV